MAKKSGSDINTLCAHFELADQDLDKVISDLHLDEIARTRCTYWQSLPSRLGLPDIVAKDIDRDFPTESDKRREFFQQWKQRKGSEATYRSLVTALLGINQRRDAEYVCELLPKAGASSSEASASSGNAQVSRYRVKLNEYCQKRGEKLPEYNCIEDRDGSKKSIFKYTVTCVIGGRKISQDSGGFYPKKDSAKEMAAKKTFLALSGGSSEAIAKPKVVHQESQSQSSTYPDVSWVSKLKEHYDRLGKSEAVVDTKYKFKTTVDGGFVYRIYVPELGREVEGEVAKSKKEAKQNAAKKALLSLPKISILDLT